MTRHNNTQLQTVSRLFGQLWVRLDPAFRRIRSRFAVDTRSLAALRIALGLTLVVDLVYRAGSIELFYTNDGIHPLSVYEATYSQYTGLSIHALSGDLWFQQFLFVVAGLFAVLYILGYRTRLVGAICFVLLFSLHARNPAVLNGGDRLLRVLLFVVLVAPLGERWSIDALRRGTARSSVVSFGTVAVLVQPLVVFTSNAVLKHEGENWYAGEALEIAFHNDVMTVYLGNMLVDYPTLMMVLNYGWVVLLAGSVVFLLGPTGRLRALAALAYMGAFAGMIVTMSVGVFPLALIASVMPFLTAPFWDTLARWVPDHWADRLPTVTSLGRLGRPPIEHRLLESLRERGHEFAASYTVDYAKSLLTICGILVVAWMLLFAAADVGDHELPDELDNPHLDQQSWGLYAPDPSESYNWYLVEVEHETETVIADVGGIATQFHHPPDAAQSYATFRHRKYMQKVRNSGEGDSNGVIATRYAEWACSQVSAGHDEPIEELTVYRIYQPSPIDGERETPKKRPFIEWECSSG